MFLFFSLTGINILCVIHNYIHMYKIYKQISNVYKTIHYYIVNQTISSVRITITSNYYRIFLKWSEITTNYTSQTSLDMN